MCPNTVHHSILRRRSPRASPSTPGEKVHRPQGLCYASVPHDHIGLLLKQVALLYLPGNRSARLRLLCFEFDALGSANEPMNGREFPPETWYQVDAIKNWRKQSSMRLMKSEDIMSHLSLCAKGEGKTPTYSR